VIPIGAVEPSASKVKSMEVLGGTPGSLQSAELRRPVASPSQYRDRHCSVLDLGLVEYGEAFRFQRAVATARESDTVSDVLILLEHPPVITLGRRANSANVIVAEEMLRSEGVALYKSTRGGDVTYHGPRQIVGYPILNLRKLGMGAAAYVHGLEAVLIDLLREYGLEGTRDSHYIGVWVGSEKVAAVGVAISAGITMHGFALNVEPNLSHFRLINPCGITDKGVTSMAQLLGRPVSVEEVRPRLVTSFARTFGTEMSLCDPGELSAAGISLP
jgi:lipoyl(octanoyl) transferase